MLGGASVIATVVTCLRVPALAGCIKYDEDEERGIPVTLHHSLDLKHTHTHTQHNSLKIKIKE